MKLSEFITDIGRPVAFYPGLKKITKSTTATIFLCQLIYWIGKSERKDGWIYKTSMDIERETGLTYEEQKTARIKLVAIGVLEQKYKRLEHNIHFKVNTIVLDRLWASSQCHDGENIEPVMANEPITPSTNEVFPDSLSTTEKEQESDSSTSFQISRDGNGDPIIQSRESMDFKPIDELFCDDCYYQVTSFYPPWVGDNLKKARETIKFIAGRIGENKTSKVSAYLRPFYLEWISRTGKTGRKYSKTGAGWLIEWAMTGEIPLPNKNGIDLSIRNRE